MRVRIDPEICQGHTLCSIVAPQLFALRDEDGYGYAITEEVPAGMEALAHEAVQSCPERAITVWDSAPGAR